MKIKIKLFACFISVLSLTACQSQYQSQIDVTMPSRQEIVSGQLIVSFKETTPLKTVKMLAEKHQMILYQELGNNSYLFASKKNVKQLEKTMQELKGESVLNSVTYNRISHTMNPVVIKK